MQSRATSGRVLLACVVLMGLLTSLGATHASAQQEQQPQKQRCAHPYPCDYRWKGPAGPFEVLPVERVSVEASDGVMLNGFIKRPKVPGDVPVPVIFAATPYIQSGTEPTSFFVGGVLGDEFAAAGYAVAYFSVRGTGDSGGCFGLKSKAEQDDLPVVIDWLAKQPWSNGRVGMQGLSYPGTTPVMAAIQNPPALKTIVIAGTILDEYGFIHSPQGASFFPAVMTLFGAAPTITAQYSLIPGSESSIATTPERVCEEVVEANLGFPRGEVTGDRGADFWGTRRFVDHVPGITAATFVVHGYQDRGGHAFQEDWAWQTLKSAPKRMLFGQWYHEWPQYDSLGNGLSLKEKDWQARLFAWLDYWLKGIGRSAPGVGDVDYLDSSGDWRRTDAWPPPLSRGSEQRQDEVLYLTEQKLQARPSKESVSFLSVVPPRREGTDLDPERFSDPTGNTWRTAPCPDPTRLVYMSDPVKQRTVLAGNPHAWLEVASSAPGGLFELQLYDVGPEFACDPQQAGEHLRALSEGSADLRYHESEDYQAHEFAPNTPVHVRVDIASLAEVLEPGHRLAVVISHGFWRGTTPELFPNITLSGDGTCESSHMVVPVISGGFGGSAPTLDYPPKPFLPECCDTEAGGVPVGTGCGASNSKNAPRGSSPNDEGDQAGSSGGSSSGGSAERGSSEVKGSIHQGAALGVTGTSVLGVVAFGLLLIAFGTALLRRTRGVAL